MTNKSKETGNNSFWVKTRPLQIAVLVIGVAAASFALFNRGNDEINLNTPVPQAISEEESYVLKLTDDVFVQTISEGVTLVDFWAAWCAPCRIQNPIIEEVAKEIGNTAKIAKLDVDNNPMAPTQLQVRNIPTLIIFKDGEPVQRFVGVQQKETLMAAIKSHI
jgi:thioredoxin 1